MLPLTDATVSNLVPTLPSNDRETVEKVRRSVALSLRSSLLT